MNTIHFIVEQVSLFDVPTTVEKLVAFAVQTGWQNPATHNLQQSLAKSGKEVKPVQVVEICKPEYSGRMLEKSDERIMSVLMPCRISVYEKADGKTYVAMVDMAAMGIDLPPAAEEAIRMATDEAFLILKSVTEAC